MSKRLIIEIDVPEDVPGDSSLAFVDLIIVAPEHPGGELQAQVRYWRGELIGDEYSQSRRKFSVKLDEGLTMRVVEAPELTALDIVEELEKFLTDEVTMADLRAGEDMSYLLKQELMWIRSRLEGK